MVVGVRLGRAPLLAAVAAGAVAVGIAASSTDVLDGWEDDTIAARFDIRGKGPDPRDVAVVGVDDRTLQASRRRWPFPRTEQAKLVDALHKLKPRLIVYDIQITEPSGNPDADFALYDAVSRARPVVMAATDTDKRGRTRVFGGEKNLRAAGAKAGSALIPPTYDHVQYEVGNLETMAIRAVELTEGKPPPRGPFAGDGAWIDFAGGPGTVPEISWKAVRDGEPEARLLTGRIVVVGVTATILQDVHETPASGGDLMTGPEIQANAIATALRGAPLRDASGALNLALILFGAVTVPLLAVRWALRALAAAPFVAAIHLGAVQFAFEQDRIVEALPPLVALIAATGGTAAALLLTEVRRRRTLCTTLARFAPDSIVDEVVERAEAGDGRLPAVELDATVLFCDLRGFTGFAERHAAPVVIETLDRYLDEVADAVMGHGGTIVAYLGDGVMAVFGAPVAQDDHADRALATGRDLVETRLGRLNEWLEQRGLEDRFALGAGLHSGPVMSGTIGSARRIEYAAVGDTTNVAARLQAHTKEAGVPLLLSGATRERLNAEDGLRPLGDVSLRGRTEPLAIWTLSG
jgi:adenylate cyclase